MPQSKEEIKEKKRQWYLKNKDKERIRAKQYKIDNKEKLDEYNKKYNLEHKEERKEKRKANRANENKWQKENRIKKPEVYKKRDAKSSWKCSGIIYDDFEEVFTHYINCIRCEYCDTEFKNSLDRCLDHDHSIIDKNNVRGVLCRQCNFADVLNVDNLEFLTS